MTTPDDNPGQYNGRVGPFTITPSPETGLVALEVDAGDKGPIVALLSPDEVTKVQSIFEHLVDHLKRGESARIDLRAAFLDMLGRDPFDGQLS